MSSASSSDVKLEIGHVLFIDIVGYSKLLINEQHELLQELNQLVRTTETFRAAEADGKLIRLPTGDGMALAFATTPDAPVQCALEISKALKSHPELRVRMGIHSGPVSGLVDVNDRSNIAGAGINMAQRVMDCGDRGHILLSRRVAEDLEQYRQWQPHLHDLGECEVKHGVRVSVVNLYTDELGNSELPENFKQAASKKERAAVISGSAKAAGPRWAMIGAAVLIIAVVTLALLCLQPKWSPPAGTAISDKSIAVLPFANLSEDKANAYFADGIQDEILTRLSKIADLKVISRTSTQHYKSAPENLPEIARQLGVAHILEGRVQKSGDAVRVNVQLIRAANDSHLWADTFDRKLTDIFSVESEVAKAIAEQLRAHLTGQEEEVIEKPSTTDLAAYDLYLRAQELFADTSDPIHARQKLPQAAKLLDEAVARDPHFLRAWCLLSRVHGAAYFRGHDHTPARLGLANAAVQTALRLQSDAGEAHLGLAIYYYNGFRDYGRARSELVIARRALPNNADVFRYTGMIDRREGHWDEATRNLERALELDPRNFFTLQQLALAYGWQHRYADEART